MRSRFQRISFLISNLNSMNEAIREAFQEWADDRLDYICEVDPFYTIEPIQAFEAGAQYMEGKAIEAFEKFVKEYSHESGRHDISENEDHYIKIFESIINSK